MWREGRQETGGEMGRERRNWMFGYDIQFVALVGESSEFEVSILDSNSNYLCDDVKIV